MSISEKMTKLLSEKSAPKTEADSHSAALHKHAKALLDAIDDGDVEGVASALKGAFLVVDSEPHPEGSHVDHMDKAKS